jgi:hypothetical protein
VGLGPVRNPVLQHRVGMEPKTPGWLVQAQQPPAQWGSGATASDVFILPAGMEYLRVMTQELCRHLQQCLKHEDVARQLTLRDLHLAYEQWACDSLQDLTEEMEMWKWDDTLDNKWARVAMCSQMLNIPIDMPEDIKEERQGTSWARATRELRRLRHRTGLLESSAPSNGGRAPHSRGPNRA